MDCDPQWTQYVSAFLVPAIAILILYLTFRQWQKTRYRTKLDLFEKRLAIYRAASQLIGSVAASGKASHRATQRYLVKTREARWLFNDAIHHYLTEDLYGAAFRLHTLRAERKRLANKKDRKKNVADQAAIRKWIVDQSLTLDVLFDPFLRFPRLAAAGSNFRIRALSRTKPPP